MPHPELAVLIPRAQKGDRAAFEKIVHHTARMVYAQIVASVRDRQKAEDLTQETFVHAWKSLDSFQRPPGEDPASPFLSWLLTIARNATLDAVKFDSRQRRGGEPGRGAQKQSTVGWPTETEGVAAKIKTATGSGGPEGESVADRSPTPAEAVATTETQQRALQVLAELPEEYRRPLSLRYLAGADYHTIRQQLGLSDGALRGLLNRGMALLRERMTKLEK